MSDSSGAASINIVSTDKGLSAEKFLYVNGGSINVNAGNDGLHSHMNIFMNGGNVSVTAKDDGIHADSSLYLNGSTVNIVTASEGMEAYMIKAQGGITSTYATDDGWNAAGGAKENIPGAGMLAMLSETTGHIVISGGYHYISAAGNMIDVLDANGTAKQTGGVLILEITGASYEAGMTGDFGDFNPGDFDPSKFNFGDSGAFNPGDMGGFDPSKFNFGDSGAFNPGDMGGFDPSKFNFGDSGAFNPGDMGGFDPGNFNMSGEGGTCSSNIPGGLIDTDAGYEITGGVLLAFGDFTTDVPKCDVISYTSDSYYGSDVAAFKPSTTAK